MKRKQMKKLVVLSALLPSLLSGSLQILAAEAPPVNSNEEQLSLPEETVVKEGDVVYFTNQDIFESMEKQGLDINDYWSKEEIRSARMQDMRRAGVNKIFMVNDTTADVYISSLIASADKVIVLAAISAIPKIGPFASAFAGMVAPILNTDTKKGVIVRLRQNANGKGWKYLSIRSQ